MRRRSVRGEIASVLRLEVTPPVAPRSSRWRGSPDASGPYRAIPDEGWCWAESDRNPWRIRSSVVPWIDVICRGEGERTGPELLAALKDGGDLSGVHGISYRHDGQVQHNPARPRIRDLDSIALPAFERIDLSRYAGYGMMTSRGCPYPCTFCSVAPVWNLESYSRSAAHIVREMQYLNQEAGVDLFLFQDEFFVSGKSQVMDFCRELKRAGLDVSWKAFGRVNLVDDDMLKAMADGGCVELRFGIESGCDRILKLIKKGFTASQALEVIPRAIDLFPRVDAFYIWGFPFETMDDFNQSLMQMISFRMMGARILPSLLSLLPQTEIYRQYASEKALEFCPYLLPEFVLTGHETCHGLEIEIPAAHREYFELIRAHPDIFSGFFHIDLEKNVLPKLELLRKFGFYPDRRPEQARRRKLRGPQSPRRSLPTGHPRGLIDCLLDDGRYTAYSGVSRGSCDAKLSSWDSKYVRLCITGAILTSFREFTGE